MIVSWSSHSNEYLSGPVENTYLFTLFRYRSPSFNKKLHLFFTSYSAVSIFTISILRQTAWDVLDFLTFLFTRGANLFSGVGGVLLSDPLSFAWGLVNFLLLFYLSALVEAGTQNRGEVSFEQLLKIQMIPRVKFSIS